MFDLILAVVITIGLIIFLFYCLIKAEKIWYFFKGSICVFWYPANNSFFPGSGRYFNPSGNIYEKGLFSWTNLYVPVNWAIRKFYI